MNTDSFNNSSIADDINDRRNIDYGSFPSRLMREDSQKNINFDAKLK
jgi:hypothetical protein